jgi:hypothetical protein
MNKNKQSLMYRYELIKTDKGMFDNYIDLVYILTTDGNKKKHIMSQINKYKPHKKILIQYSINSNKLDKQLSINEAYYNVFLNALQHNYKNIIVFEDDFTFDYNINQLVVDDIGNFIKNNNYHIYHLGSLFHISIPSISMHLKSYYITSSHGVIYNRDYVYHYIKKYEVGLKRANDKVWLDLNIIKYTYYKPLCFQTINKNIFGKVIKLFKLNTNNSYKIFNIISFIISFHLIYLFLNHKFFLGLK